MTRFMFALDPFVWDKNNKKIFVNMHIIHYKNVLCLFLIFLNMPPYRAYLKYLKKGVLMIQYNETRANTL